ncbi:hypothetical protein C5N99_06240 [Treponema medium]|uniref:Lipoprotein n=2 Tax=Treponema medium TaxID=58231 RepID=A0AA87NT63_TREMD|nr:hypothetical protein [Treponema medium]EPF28980.1 hypothetical protein HMPREF9195_01222 [Treponema medium ATCC 700293]QSH92205.1 hypothetical protein C5N99_06240 [Treponema medium]QSH97343.1 hypothetical protein DWB79_06195 [Treponema medium]
MRNIILFLIIGTLVTLVLIVGCSAVCAAIIILLAKFVNEHILAALPFSVIAGIVLSFFFYGKIMKKIMNKYGLNNKK